MTEFRLWSKNFVLICVATFLYFGSFYLLIPTLPQYVAELGGTPGQIGLVMGAFTLAAVLFRPYFGKLADLHGRKRLMLAGAGSFALLFGLYGQLQAVIPLYALRVAHGVAHAGFLAASSAYIADLAPPHRRGEVMGIYGTSMVVAMALFPAWGIAVIQHTGSFAVLFTISVVTATAGFLALSQLAEIGSKADRGKPISIMAVFRRWVVLLSSVALFVAATAYGAVLTFLPVYAPERGIKDFGVFFTVFAIATLSSRVLAGRLSDRIGRRKVILPFMALLAMAAFLLPFLHEMYMLVIISICFGLGFGAFMPTLNALVVDETPPQERGSALGVFTSFMDLGITAGSVVLGIAGEYLGYAVMFGVAGVIIVAGLVVFAAGMPASQPSDV